MTCAFCPGGEEDPMTADSDRHGDNSETRGGWALRRQSTVSFLNTLLGQITVSLLMPAIMSIMPWLTDNKTSPWVYLVSAISFVAMCLIVFMIPKTRSSRQRWWLWTAFLIAFFLAPVFYIVTYGLFYQRPWLRSGYGQIGISRFSGGGRFGKAGGANAGAGCLGSPCTLQVSLRGKC